MDESIAGGPVRAVLRKAANVSLVSIATRRGFLDGHELHLVAVVVEAEELEELRRHARRRRVTQICLPAASSSWAISAALAVEQVVGHLVLHADLDAR